MGRNAGSTGYEPVPSPSVWCVRTFVRSHLGALAPHCGKMARMRAGRARSCAIHYVRLAARNGQLAWTTPIWVAT